MSGHSCASEKEYMVDQLQCMIPNLFGLTGAWTPHLVCAHDQVIIVRLSARVEIFVPDTSNIRRFQAQHAP